MDDVEWMTRLEAADYLRVSVRQLNRLGLPRTVLGNSPRYSRVTLDEYMARFSTTPGQRKRGGPGGPPLVVSDGKSFSRLLAKRRHR
jgi:hypothetical protein